VPDESLILKSQQGDGLALEELFRRYDRLLRARASRTLTGRVRPKISVSDILQEARLAAHLHVADFVPQGRGSVKAWLARIVERQAQDAVRRYAGTAKRAAGREASGDMRPPTAELVGGEPSPSEVAAAGETAAAVRRALDALPNDYREILRLTRQNHMSIGEAAQCLGKTRDAAKKLYARALARLTELLPRESQGRP
jgi:RNA polymerase sigma-70 factor (ECF subfamily)